MFVGFTYLQALQKNPFLVSLQSFKNYAGSIRFSFSWNCISITLNFFFLTVAFSLLLLHSMFSFQGTSRQKKLHIVRFRRQAHASRRKLIHSVLLPFQIRSASLGSNLVLNCLTLSLKRLNEVSTVIEASFNLLEELKFIRAADSSTSSLFTLNY